MRSQNKPNSLVSAFNSLSYPDPGTTMNSLVSILHKQTVPSFFSNDLYTILTLNSNLPSLKLFYSSRLSSNFLGCSFCKSPGLLISIDPNPYCHPEVINDFLTIVLIIFGQDCLWLVKSSLGSMSKRVMSHSASTLNLVHSNELFIWSS